MTRQRFIRGALWQAVALAVAVSYAAEAEVIQKWRMKSGQLYFGDKPPAGSTKLGEIGAVGTIGEVGTSEPAAPAGTPDEAPARSPERDRLSVQASRERREIEKSLRHDAERFAEVQERFSEVERWPNVVEPWMEKSLGLTNEKGSELKKLRGERRDLATAMIKSWQRFEDVDKRVRKGFGGSSPDWWRKPSCAKCPSPSDLRAAVE